MTIRIDALVAASKTSSTRADWAPWAVPSSSGSPAFPPPLPMLGTSEVEGLLLHDWRANREITQLAGDLVAEPFEVEGLPGWVDPKALSSWIEGDDDEGKPGLLSALGEWWAVGEAYGGSLLVAVVDDGKPASEPLDRSTLRTILAWEVLDRWSVWPYRRRGTGSPVDYWVVTANPGAYEITRASQIIHPSRVQVHTGRWMPKRWRDWQDGWGASRLELLLDQRNTLRKGHQAIGRLLRRSSQDVIALAELTEMQADYGPEYTRDRLREMAATLDSDETLFLDGGISKETAGGQAGRDPDKFESVARPFGGVDAIEELQHNDWRRGSGMPSVVADGDAAAGLNGGSEAGPWRAWARYVKAIFKRDLLGGATKGLGLIFSAKEGPTGGRVPETYCVKPVDIAEPDYEREAKIDQLETLVDQMQFDGGQITEEEITQWRNVDGKRGRVRVDKASRLPDPEETSTSLEGNAATEVQQLALNGAQMSALLEITSSVTSGLLPPGVASWLIGLSVPGIPTGPAATALNLAEAWGKAHPQQAAATATPPRGVALDAAIAFARAFDLDVVGQRLDASSPIEPWAAAIGERLDSRHEHEKAGVMVEIPDKIARLFPWMESAPHVTVLFIGPTPWDQVEKVREAVAQLAVDLLPVRARLGKLGYFPRPDGSRVAWVGVEFEPSLVEYHDALRTELMRRGVMVQHPDRPYVPHATLGIVGPGEDYSGPLPPAGVEWLVERFEVWHGE